MAGEEKYLSAIESLRVRIRSAWCAGNMSIVDELQVEIGKVFKNYYAWCRRHGVIPVE